MLTECLERVWQRERRRSLQDNQLEIESQRECDREAPPLKRYHRRQLERALERLTIERTESVMGAGQAPESDKTDRE